MVSEINLNHVRDSLRDLKPGEAIKKAEALSRHYGVTVQTIYRWAAKKGLRWRPEKATKGKSSVSRDVAIKAGTILYASRRTSRQITITECDAREALEDSGIDTGGVSMSRFRARMRQEKASARDILQPSPHQTLLSAHPNHVWQFDVTNCIQYFLDDKKGMGERDSEMELYKNKIVKTAQGIKKELLRYAAVDHCSGAFYARYFYASGERADDGSQFLYEAMRQKDELIRSLWNGDAESKLGKYRFHGVPFILVVDRGSIATAKRNQNLFDALRIKLEPHMPGNPRAKGAIEGLMKIINRFEGWLKFQRPANLAELNRWLLDWCIKFNAVNKMRGVAPRSVLWSKITEVQLRLCPDETLYRLLIRQPEITRTASGGRIIQVDNRHYQIPDPNSAGQKVTVVRHPYEHPAVEVHFNGYIWLCQPIPMDEYGRLTSGVPYGEYRAIKQTDAQKTKKEMEAVASEWGLTWKGTGDKRMAVAPPLGQASPLLVFGHQADKVGNLEFIDKRGTPLDVKQPEAPDNERIKNDACEVERSIVARHISIDEFLKRIVQCAGPITREINRSLRAQYGASITIKEAETVIAAIQEGTWLATEEAAIGSTG